MSKTAIIIGAGPAGLTAAYELITRTEIKPIVLEKTNDIGGISKTVTYKGNRIDIGGHRFFSKSDIVMNWWKNIMPIQSLNSIDDLELAKTHPGYKSYKNLDPNGVDPQKTDKVMLFRNRLSRIFFLRTFFDYPISLSIKTFLNLGFYRIIKIGITYLWVRISPIKKEENLEDFFINRFGSELYKTFFKDYTEKVWGVPCSEIAADWGVQRIKDLSVIKTILHAFKSVFKREKSIEQLNINTSLIGQFLYPKLGPGSMWETVADIIKMKGGEIILNSEVIGITPKDGIILDITYIDGNTDKKQKLTGDYFFSTMPVKELINALELQVPDEVKTVSDGLQYRDFITVGLLLTKLKVKNKTKIPTLNNIIPDNWIYIQERDVKIGRLQIFNNWSPYMVKDPNKIWIGLEYFCNEGDNLWTMEADEFVKFAIDELHKIDIIDKNDVEDSTYIRVPKAYPAYFGTHSHFNIIRDFTDKYENLFLIGRNGMHKYNNADHSMLSAITAVENIRSGIKTKENIWDINTNFEYHEKK